MELDFETVNIKALRNYLKTVTLSEAKGLACQKERFFAALRMTRYVLR
jgi:hypothetical protein